MQPAGMVHVPAQIGEGIDGLDGRRLPRPRSTALGEQNATYGADAAPTPSAFAARVRRSTVPAPGVSPAFLVTDGRLGNASDADILIASGTTTITTDKDVDQVRVAAGAVLEIARGARIFARSAVVNNGTIRAIATNEANASGGAPTLGSGSTHLIGAAGGNAGANGTTTNGAKAWPQQARSRGAGLAVLAASAARQEPTQAAPQVHPAPRPRPWQDSARSKPRTQHG